jgi:predicted  nucleic acid-binding Zn-ribbon protein
LKGDSLFNLRLLDVCNLRNAEKEDLHKQVSELQIAIKKTESSVIEVEQLKKREVDLQRMMEDLKSECDQLRSKGGSSSGDGSKTGG